MATAILWWLAVSRPWGFVPGWVALAPIVWAARGMTPRRALRFGWGAGAMGFWLVNWWIIPTIAHAAPSIGLPVLLGAPLGALAVLIIALVHGLQVALSLSLAQRARAWRGPWAMAAVFALAWGVGEWARTLGSGAHSWGALAFSQWRDLPMLQNVRWMGQHGLSAFCAFCAAALALGLEAWLRSRRNAPSPSSPASTSRASTSPNTSRAARSSAPGSPVSSSAAQPGRSLFSPRGWNWAGAGALWGVPLAALALLHGWGSWRLAAHPARGSGARASGSGTLKVLLVQTNLASVRKDSESPVSAALRLTNDFFALHPNAARPDVVVWPETTLSGFIHRRSGAGESAGAGEPERVEGLEAEQVRGWARARGVPVLVGSSLHDIGLDGRKMVRNDAVWFEPDGSVQRRGKTRPVPFGERALFSEWMPFLETFAPSPMVEPDKARGPMKVLSRGRALAIGTVICFESAFSHPALEAARGAQALMVLTNDEWFGQTEAPFQHAAMGVLRAVECGVPLAQAANGGRSFAVDRYGRALQQDLSRGPIEPSDGMAPVHREEVLEMNLPLDDAE